MEEYVMESVARGHHVQKSVWHQALGEQLTLEKENSNSHDRYAVSVTKDGTIVVACETNHRLGVHRKSLARLIQIFAFFVVVLHQLKLLLPAISLPTFFNVDPTRTCCSATLIE